MSAYDKQLKKIKKLVVKYKNLELDEAFDGKIIDILRDLDEKSFNDGIKFATKEVKSWLR